jgi:hypothetical protein
VPNGHKEGIDRLEKRITTLKEALTNLSTDHDWEELSLIMRRPGWTTPAELAFAQGIVECLLTHTQALAQLKGVLVKGSGAVSIR